MSRIKLHSLTLACAVAVSMPSAVAMGSKPRIDVESANLRIQPVARVSTALPKPAGEVKMTGQEVYNKVCAACHAAGVLGAPKTGDKALWEPRFAQSLDTLVTHAVTGIRAMPAKGGDPSLTETHIKDAIIYMLGESGIKVEAAPVAAAPAKAAPAPAQTAPETAAPAPAQ